MVRKSVTLIMFSLLSWSIVDGMNHDQKDHDKIDVKSVKDFERVIEVRNQYRQTRRRGFFSEDVDPVRSQLNKAPIKQSKTEQKEKK